MDIMTISLVNTILDYDATVLYYFTGSLHKNYSFLRSQQLHGRLAVPQGYFSLSGSSSEKVNRRAQGSNS